MKYTIHVIAVLFSLAGLFQSNTTFAAAPNAPTVTPNALTGLTNTVYTFDSVATDPDGDQIYYAIDWNDDGGVDETVPGAAYVNSGEHATLANPSTLWSSPGQYRFRVRAEDANAEVSSWTTVFITVVQAPTLTYTIDGNTNTVTRYAPNASYTLNWWNTDTDTCTASGDWTGSKNLNSSETFGMGSNEGYYGYTLSCANIGGVASKTVTAIVTQGPLQRPTNVVATPDGCDLTKMNVTWNAMPYATHYMVFRDGVMIATTSNTSYTDTGLIPNTPHQYSIRTIRNVVGTNGQVFTYSYLTTVASSNVIPACSLPDLISQGLNYQSGGCVTQQNPWPPHEACPVTFIANVVNIGSQQTGSGFTDKYYYKWGNSGQIGPGGKADLNDVIGWTEIQPVSQNAMAANSTSSESITFTLPGTGFMYMAHCVDTENQITEANETPNCVGTGSYYIAPPLAPTVTLTPTSTIIKKGTAANLTWNVSGSVTSCTASGDWAGSKSTSGGTESTGSLDTLKTYDFGISCAGPGGTSTVKHALVKTIEGDISADSPKDFGTTTTVTWSSQNTSGLICEVTDGSDDWSPNTSGTEVSHVLTTAGQYVLACGYSLSNLVLLDAAQVLVNTSPILTVSPRVVLPGEDATIYWTVYENGCTLSGGGRQQAISGTDSAAFPITAQTTFTVQCPSTGSASVTVEITPTGFES